MSSPKNRLGLGLLVPCAVLASSAAHGQQPDIIATTLEEVMVTAQKREQRLIDVPIAVTAVTAADIEARGVATLQDMQYSVPGLVLAETGPGVGRLQLNGIGIAGGSTGLPAVAVYLDEVPITAAGGGTQMDLRLLDMQRVEVLHGPQPTLYGEGSMGGTIHYVTADPDLNEFGGHVEGRWGSVTDGSDNYSFQGVLNAPIVDDKFGVRILANYQKDGGWIDSNYTGAKDINSLEVKTVRAKFLYRPTEDVSASLMWMHQEHDQPYQNFSNYDRTSNIAYPLANSDKYDLGNLVVNWNFGPATLLSSTGFLHRNPKNAYDLTQYLVPFLPFFGLPPEVVETIQIVGYPLEHTDNMFSQEFRLASNDQGPFNYVLGAYYRNYRTSAHNYTTTAPGTLPFMFYDSYGDSKSETWALFGEVRYAISDRLEVLLGLRHFHEDQTGNQYGYGIFDPSEPVVTDASFSSNNPRFNLSYKTSDRGIVYLNIAKGFRSGQANVPFNGVTPPPVGPEKLWTYMLGTKQDLMDRRLSIDLSVYYNDWTDIQTLQVTADNPNGYYANAGKASGTGVNFALTARPVPELTLSATVGWTDMQYDTTTRGTYKGDPIHMVADWTYSAAVDWRKPLASGSTVIARADYAHTDGYTLTIRDIPPALGPQQYFSDTRDIVNARVGMDFGKYQVYLFADNLTDDNGSIYPAVGAFPEPILPMPRTIGLEANFSF